MPQDAIRKIYPKWSVKYKALSKILDRAANNYLPQEGRMVTMDGRWTTYLHLGAISFDPAFARPPVVVETKRKTKKSAKKSGTKES